MPLADAVLDRERLAVDGDLCLRRPAEDACLKAAGSSSPLGCRATRRRRRRPEPPSARASPSAPWRPRRGRIALHPSPSSDDRVRVVEQDDDDPARLQAGGPAERAVAVRVDLAQPREDARGCRSQRQERIGARPGGMMFGLPIALSVITVASTRPRTTTRATQTEPSPSRSASLTLPSPALTSSHGSVKLDASAPGSRSRRPRSARPEPSPPSSASAVTPTAAAAARSLFMSPPISIEVTGCRRLPWPRGFAPSPRRCARRHGSSGGWTGAAPCVGGLPTARRRRASERMPVMPPRLSQRRLVDG